MAITGKQYVDLEGLSKFKELLVAGYANGDFSVLNATNATNAEIATKYKTADGSASIETALASKADSATLTTEVGKRVPKTATIAGVDLQDNITAEELVSALDKSSKIINVIETVKVRNNGETDFTPLTVSNKTVQIDLSSYAKTSDITAVLKFKGVESTLESLNTNHPASKDQVGHVWIVTEGAEYAEYVCVDTNGDTDGGYKWEKLGVGVDLSGYYTKEQTDTAISDAVKNAKTEITSAYQSADTALKNELQGKINALYQVVDGGTDTGVIATRLSDVETKATNNASAIATLKGDANTTGSVAKAIKDKIDALDSTSSVASDSDTKGGYVYSVSQTDGKVAVKTASFSGAVASEDTNAVTGGAVATYVTGEIAKLDVTDIGSAGSFISAVGETAGKIHATPTAFATSVNADTTASNNIAPTEHAVRTAIDSAYNLITAVPTSSITALFSTSTT